MKKFILLSILIIAGCAPEKVNDGKKRVTVSIVPLKYFVDRIGGGDFEVTVLTPPGASPESYEPLPSQMKEIALSDAYFHFGLIDFERALADGVVSKHPSLTAVDLSRGMEIMGDDPHVWVSPKRMELAAQAILETLGRIYPDSTAKYTSNFTELADDMESLHEHIHTSLDSLPRREFVITHPFLSYYAADYDLTQIPLEHDGKEPSAGQMAEVMDEIREHGINTIFCQKGMSDKGAAAVATRAGITTLEADPLEYDWMDNMYSITYTLALTMQ